MAFAKILATTDFSAPAQQATQRAANLAKQSGGQLRVVHTIPDATLLERLLHRGEITHGAMLRGAEKALQTTCEKIERTHDIETTWAVVIGSAHRAILETAATFGSDLVVIGARGSGGSSFQGSPLGGTAVKVLASSTLPVLLVRRSVEDRYRRLLTAVDDSEAARRVLAVSLQVTSDAECYLLHAFEAPFAERLRVLDVASATIDAYASEQRAEVQRTLDALRAEAKAGDRIRPLIVRGDPVSAVLAEISRLQPDLAIVGKHDSRRRGTLLSEFGSVGLRVAYEAPSDVLQVP